MWHPGGIEGDYHDGNIEDDDDGVAPEAVAEICESVLDTKHNLERVIGDVFGWIPSPDLLAAVLTKVAQCLGCHRWIHADRTRCAACAKEHAATMPESKGCDLWLLSLSDIRFLHRLAVNPDYVRFVATDDREYFIHVDDLPIAKKRGLVKRILERN